MTDRQDPGPRCIALVGPYLSGKTSLLESILHLTGAASRKGSVGQGNSVGDSSPEARARGMSTELNVATANYLDDSFTFLDCPGSIEFLQETLNAAVAIDAAVVVCEADTDRMLALAPVLKLLGDRDIPHVIFVNKIDKTHSRISDVFEALKRVSGKPLLLRQIPIKEGDDIVGYVDLASQRAYRYGHDASSQRIDVPEAMADEVAEARFAMLETMSDFDDALMEILLEDEEPEIGYVFGDLTKEHRAGQVVSVVMGAGEHDNGVKRLLKALRHEAPGFAMTRRKLDFGDVSGDVVAQVLKTYHTAHGGKLSVARVLRGEIRDGMSLAGERVSGLYHMLGSQTRKVERAGVGEVVALGRLDKAGTGDTLTAAKDAGGGLPRAEILPPVFSLSLSAEERSDEVKLSGAVAKVIEEDSSISVEHSHETNEFVLWGQGEIHLRVVADKLMSKYGLKVTTRVPRVPYKEAIRKSIVKKARHKKQTGGHGQFGEVVLEIKPLPRGSGFSFEQKISGGVVPKQYIPSVGNGVRDYLGRGPLGFPVVDIAVTLIDGSFHAVDSSDMAFRTAGRMAMSQALPQCSPVLLEPIINVRIVVPSEFTAKVNALISGRRGQILGFDARDGWDGWDAVSGFMPQSEIHDLIVELRSLSQGVGTYQWKFDHLAELTGKLADDVIAAASDKAA